MKKKLFTLLFVLATVGFICLPTSAKALEDTRTTNLSLSTTLKANNQVRYVRIRGKRYKVWYKTFRRNGRRYVRITRIRRA